MAFGQHPEIACSVNSVCVAIAQTAAVTYPQPSPGACRSEGGGRALLCSVALGPGSVVLLVIGEFALPGKAQHFLLTNIDFRSFWICKCGINSCWIHYTE